MPEDPESSAGRSVFALLRDLYLAPSEAFADLASAPRVAPAFLGLAAVQAAFMAVWMSRMDMLEFVRAQAAARGGQAPAAGAIDPSSLGAIKWMMALSGVALAPLVLLLLAGLLLFVFNFLLGASSTYRQAVAVVAWTAFASGLVTASLMLLVMALRGEWSLPPDQVVQANLGVFFEREDAGAFLHSLATSLDLFTLWMLFLTSLGMAKAARLSTRVSAATLGALWLALVLAKAGLAAAF